jgi:hypothetical protein
MSTTQGCQIFLDTVYQNGGKDTKLPINYQWPNNKPFFSFPRPSKIYPNWDFGLKINHLATLVSTANERIYGSKLELINFHV